MKERGTFQPLFNALPNSLIILQSFNFIPSLLSTTPSSFPSFLLSQAEKEMECLEAALKSSFRKDMALKQTLFLEEFSSASNVQNVVASSDDLFVDDLLNFSLLENNTNNNNNNEEPDQQLNNHDSTTPQNNQENYNYNPSFNDNNFNTELTVPAEEEVADLEWLSRFVEDSNFSEYSLPFPATVTEKVKVKSPEPGNTAFTFKTPVPAKARSKRTRTGVRVWPLKSPSLAAASSTTTSSSRAKKRAAADGGAARRCSHCGVQKTPQWRTGPLGAKTLCNACGVRYKSGRLLPEYRPACSPTFSSELHSNHHRKVLEMRRKKEDVPEPDTASPPSLPGF